MGAGEKIATLSSYKFKTASENAANASAVAGPRLYGMSKSSKSEQPATSPGTGIPGGVEAGARVDPVEGAEGAGA